MTTVVAQKWGNSLGIRIPKEAAEKIGINQGAKINLSVSSEESTIILKPTKTKKTFDLNELIAQITPENRHDEVTFGLEGRELV